MPVDPQFDDPIKPFGCRVENVTAAEEKNLRHSDEQRPKEPDRPQLGIRLKAIEGVSEEDLGSVHPTAGRQVDEREP